MPLIQTAQPNSVVPDPSGVDWNAVWNEKMRRHRSCREKLGVDSGPFSRPQARDYWDMVQITQQERLARILCEIETCASSRMLDIGSGPGVLALPLAKISQEVTAVDPCEAMISVLTEKAALQGIQNVICINKKWEDVDLERDLSPPYDTAIASLSLNMLDIRGCLEKITAAVSGKIMLYWFAGETGWEVRRRELFLRLHKVEYVPIPKSDIIFNLLYQMGIYPHLGVFPYLHVDGFCCFDEALIRFVQSYGVSGSAQTDELRRYLLDNLVWENGGCRLYSPAVCMKMWWNSRDFPPRTFNPK